jgi:hypothetical protein
MIPFVYSVDFAFEEHSQYFEMDAKVSKATQSRAFLACEASRHSISKRT